MARASSSRKSIFVSAPEKATSHNSMMEGLPRVGGDREYLTTIFNPQYLCNHSRLASSHRAFWPGIVQSLAPCRISPDPRWTVNVQSLALLLDQLGNEQAVHMQSLALMMGNRSRESE